MCICWAVDLHLLLEAASTDGRGRSASLLQSAGFKMDCNAMTKVLTWPCACFLTLKCPVISTQFHISAPQITGMVLLRSCHTKPPVDSKRNYTSASCHGVKHRTITVKWREKKKKISFRWGETPDAAKSFP